MGGGNPFKNAWESDTAKLVVPIVAAAYTGGALGGVSGAVGAGTVSGAAGGAAAMATSDAVSGSPISSEPPPTPDLATVNDPSAVDRATRFKQRLAAAAGRGSTFLTGPQGLGNSGAGGGKTLLGM